MNLHQTTSEYGKFGEFSRWPNYDIGYGTYYFTTGYHELFFRPITVPTMRLEGQHTIIKLIYDPKESNQLRCYSNLSFTETNERPPDPELVKKLKGRIFLQVESHGEAYYVNPKDSKRYYMVDGNEAYRIMRYLGVGITNKNLEKIKTNKTFAKNNSGKIFLQVEANGEAYYIDFNGNSHYLKDGSVAYTVMRDLGLGITNIDLSKIPEGSL